MLNITMKGSYQDPTGFTWDYYGDDANASTFYIVPRPQFVFDDRHHPSFQITRYKTGDANDGAGYCRFDIELSVPSDVEAAIRDQIPQKFPGAKAPYFFVSMNYNPGGRAYFDFASSAGTVTYSAPVSSFGSNVASFLIEMTKEQLDTYMSAFATEGSPFEVEYHVSVPARLPAVNATLSFDSAIAFQYQVTQPSYDSWGDETSPGSVQEMLKESASSKVTIEWGTSNPSAALRQAVADWANDTLADLVSAEVQKTIALHGLSSDRSFSINEVSSFTNTYAENMVIDWIIAPKAALPSFPALGLNVADFTATVDERQQQMTVSAFLPFSADGSGPPLPDGSPQALVDHVTVTVSYPGLDQQDATYTFTQNESHTFTAPYDEKAGPNWSLTYTVTYVDKNMPAVKSAAPIAMTSGSYTLQVAEAGILTVVFDAQQAFASEGTKPTEIDVAFSYINSDGSARLIQQVVKIMAADNPQQGSVTSYYPVPINSQYNYQVTYVFPGGVQYQAPLVQGQTGFRQILPAANAVHSCNLIVYVSAAVSAGNPLLDGPTVQMYYAQQPTTPPGVGSQPTADSPAVFTITPATDSSQNTIGRATFVGLRSGDQPLVYSASLDMANGQIDIDNSLVENDQASVLVTPTQRYYTLQISPAAIDWKTASFQSVQVLVSAQIAQGSAPTAPGSQPPERAYTWNEGESGSKYITYSIQDGNAVSYDWQVNYITPGQAVQSASGSKASDVILDIPPAPVPKASAA